MSNKPSLNIVKTK